MKRPPASRPRRPRDLIERPLPWVLLTLLVLVAVAGAAFLLFKSIQNSGGASGRGAFYLITFLGIVALLLIWFTFFYTARKRRRALQEHLPGSMMAWFKSHIYFGVLALLVAVVHILSRPISSGITTGKITLVVFVILVLSGIAWRVVYVTVPPRVARSVGNLAVVDSEKRLGEIHVEIDKLAAGKSAQFQALVNARLQSGQQPLIDQQAATLGQEERDDWQKIRVLAEERDRLQTREGRQRRYERFLQRWKVLHIPLAAILLGLIAVHIFDVFGGGRVAFGGEAREFPSSETCAGCHSQIAKQWHQSVMSHAVSSPVMIAQVALAVKENREAGHPLGTICTACHGPIGTALTNKDTLPFKSDVGLPTDPEGGGKDLVLGEGVTCVVCHALDNAPGVGDGAKPLPVNHAGLTSLGVMHGPKLPGGEPIPVPDHQIVTGGYMGERDAIRSDEIQTSNLCGACHEVAVDLNNDKNIDRKAEPGKQPDLVLQTTYLEWAEDYAEGAANLGVSPQGCVACHAQATQAPIVDSAPFGGSPPERVQHNHAFVGVDYDLTPGHPGLSQDEFDQFLQERTDLLRQAVGIAQGGDVNDAPGFSLKLKKSNGQLEADVKIKNLGDGHTLPTGFAFVRQMWIEISAKDADTGSNVCLTNVQFTADNDALVSPCASGETGAKEDLNYCDEHQLAAAFPKTAALKDANGNFTAFGNRDIVLAKGAAQPPDLAKDAAQPPRKCDPWLVSWQKLLTDASNPIPGKDAPTRHEVAYQSKIPDIVALRQRVTGPELITGKVATPPMDPPGIKFNAEKRTVGDTQIWPYLFKIQGLKGHQVDVTATLHFRHLSPYFLRALDGLYPSGLTSADLIENLVDVDMARATTQTKI